MKNKLKKLLVLFCVSSIFSLGKASAEKIPVYQNEDYSFEERALDIISRMTLEEKVSQMGNSAPAINRLNIPRYDWWNECLHGLARSGKSTIFPQSIGLGATFDPSLMFDMASAISDEARAFYNAAIKIDNRGIYRGLTFYSPNVNLFRDPRWGRGQETYGEDPLLISRMGVNFVKALQGNDSKYFKTVACAKHFAVHSGPEEFRHHFDAKCSFTDLHETYLPAFKALVTKAKVGSVMGAYNRTNGEACCASKTLLTDILRGDWGFKGYVTSDCGAVNDFYTGHKIVKNYVEAAALGANNGLNLNCGNVYQNDLVKAVQQGLVSEKTIDDLLYPLMYTRFKLGMFDDSSENPYNKIGVDCVDSKLHKDIAYKTAAESFVLLQNKNNVLPLDQSKTKYIFVTGPNANNPDALIGNYFGVSDNLTTFLEGIVNRANPGVSIQYKQGALLERPNVNPIDWASGEASQADAVVACMGITWLIEGEEGESLASDQKGDMRDNSFPKAQLDYLKKLKAKQKKGQSLIVVVSGGCPLQLNEVQKIADAIIYAWYPGEEGGNALADVIFGNISPSGKTPITFIKSLDQIPAFEDYSMKGRTYKYMTKEPLYPFGYGLSYTNFKYSDLKYSSKIKAGQGLDVTVSLTNIGNMSADEVVQLYVTDEKASVDVPIRQLADFKRVSLKVGETKTIHLSIDPVKMSLIKGEKRLIESGDFSFSVGSGQPVKTTKEYLTGKYTVRGNKRIEL